MFAAVAATVGYILMSVPNIEGVTAVLFVAGYVLNFRLGVLAAVIAALLYFGLNPQGGMFPPLLAAQVLGIAAAPIAGATLRSLKRSYPILYLYLGLSAVIVTIWYDLLTNIAFPLSAGFDFRGIMVTLAAGIPFSLIHIAGNTAVFVLIIPAVLKVVDRYIPSG